MTHRPRIHFVLLLESALFPATILVAFVARRTYQSTRIAFTLRYPRIKGACSRSTRRTPITIYATDR